MQVSRHESGSHVDRVAATFRLLGDPTRIRILTALCEHDELCVHEIAAVTDSSDTKVSQALRLLRTAGLVHNRRDGRHIHYRITDDRIRTLLAAMDVEPAAEGAA